MVVFCKLVVNLGLFSTNKNEVRFTSIFLCL